MALYATNRFAGDGTTTQYEINFIGQYIDRSHVKAYRVDDATQVRTHVTIAPGQWLNATTITNFAPTPVGQTLVIYRDTPKAPMVDFVNGTRFTEYNMDLVARQGLFVAMETLDSNDPEAHAALLAALGTVTQLVADTGVQLSEATLLVQDAAVSASQAAGSASAAASSASAAKASASSIDPAYLRDRANHTGTQAISTVAGLQSALDNKFDKAGEIVLPPTADIPEGLSSISRASTEILADLGIASQLNKQVIQTTTPNASFSWLWRTYIDGTGYGTGIAAANTNSASALFLALQNSRYTFAEGGMAYKLGGGSFADSSDVRLKTNIKDWGVGLAAINQLKVRSWNFLKETGRDPDKEFIGLVAQEAEQVAPNLVHTADSSLGDMKFSDMRFVNPSDLTYMLINAVQELSARVTELERKLAI